MSSCQSDYTQSSFDGKPHQDVKPSYLIGYDAQHIPTTTSSQEPTNPEALHKKFSEVGKLEYEAYYQKLSAKSSPEDKVVPKSEAANSSSCCSSNGSSLRNEQLLVPKAESNPCRAPTPVTNAPQMRPTYESYMNQDSNSSSMSSNNMEKSIHHLHHPAAHIPQHHNPHQHPVSTSAGSVPPPSGYSIVDDSRLSSVHQMPSGRSPYQQLPTDELYRPELNPGRPYGDMTTVMGTTIARPVVTYSTDMASRAYDVNSASHRPYDPGTTNTAFERYDSSAAVAQSCTNLQQQAVALHPSQRVAAPQGMYPPYTSIEEQEQRYQQEAVAAQQHQMAVATAAAAGMMKSEQGSDPENTGPLYPR